MVEQGDFDSLGTLDEERPRFSGPRVGAAFFVGRSLGAGSQTSAREQPDQPRDCQKSS